jgi:hypothetical protein
MSTSHLRNRIGSTAILTIVTVAGISAVSTAPAMAGANCSAGFHCVFHPTQPNLKYSFANSDPDFSDNFYANGESVNNNVGGASNSSTGGFESHYYNGPNYTGGFLFCVNPGGTVRSLPINQRDRVSSLRLQTTTTIRCLSN